MSAHVLPIVRGCSFITCYFNNSGAERFTKHRSFKTEGCGCQNPVLLYPHTSPHLSLSSFLLPQPCDLTVTAMQMLNHVRNVNPDALFPKESHPPSKSTPTDADTNGKSVFSRQLTLSNIDREGSVSGELADIADITVHLVCGAIHPYSIIYRMRWFMLKTWIGDSLSERDWKLYFQLLRISIKGSLQSTAYAMSYCDFSFLLPAKYNAAALLCPPLLGLIKIILSFVDSGTLVYIDVTFAVIQE